MKHVLLIRHGAAAGNLEKRYLGRTDEPLCPQGEAQVKALAREGLQADRLFVSPALRTRQTAALLFPGLTGEIVPDLRETDFGIFEGKTAAELSRDPRYRAWVDTFCQGPIPGGDDVKDWKARCRLAFFRAMEGVPEGKTAAFVIHGGSIMAILEGFADPPCGFYDHHLPPGGLLRCAYRENTLFITSNQVVEICL